MLALLIVRDVDAAPADVRLRLGEYHEVFQQLGSLFDCLWSNRERREYQNRLLRVAFDYASAFHLHEGFAKSRPGKDSRTPALQCPSRDVPLKVEQYRIQLWRILNPCRDCENGLLF